MLTNTKKMLNDAKNNKYAIGAFNFTTIEQMQTILKIANDLNSPVILAASSSAIKYIGIQTIVAVAKVLETTYAVDFALHLDHGKTFEECKLAIDAGFTSVMIDGSMHPIEKNKELTKRVVNYAKPLNITVEAELGVLAGIEDDLVNKETLLTNPNEAVNFIEKTNIDSLAVSIGTSHGAYKYKGDPSLDFKRLKEIKNKTQIPLVLHGASSLDRDIVTKPFEKSGGKLHDTKGVPLDMTKKAIDNGICKVNIDTDLRISYTTGIRDKLKNPELFNIRDYQSFGLNQMTFTISNLIKKILRSENKNTWFASCIFYNIRIE